MHQKGIAPILIVILIAAVAGLGGFLIYSQQPKLTPPPQEPPVSRTPQTTPAPSSPSDKTADWKTYTDKMNRFTFKYPPMLLLKEDVGGNNNVFYADLKNEQEEFRFEAGPKEYVGLLEHFSSNQIDEINGVSWIKIAAAEYCDAGNCGPTAPGFYIKKDNYYVGVLEFKKDQSSQTLKKILSTFRFDSSP